MEEARQFSLRPLLVVAAVVSVIATLWAAGAFASGGSSSQNDPSGSPPAMFVQDQQDPQAPWGEDCPEGSGGPAPWNGDGPPGESPDGPGSSDL